jgi:two-component system chemotaxis sensor kinase CheA
VSAPAWGDTPLDLSSVIQVFIDEAEERLQALVQSLLSLEAAPASLEPVQEMLRQAHTLKGSSASLGFERIAAVVHTLEDHLEGLRDGQFALDAALVTLLLELVDALRVVVRVARFGEQEDTGPAQAVLGRIAQARARLAGQAPARVPVAPAVAAQEPDSQPRTTVRVEGHKLDWLLDVAGGLALAHARLAELVRAGVSHEVLLSTLTEGERRLRELEELVLQVRLVPVGPVLQEHQRTVRDAASACGKAVRLLVESTGAEVDTHVAARLRPALTHLLRNAVDHGIEAPSLRAARGKPAEGTLLLRAEHRAGSLVLTLSDDGGGLDRARILERGRALGLVAPEERPSDAALDALIFAAGFSTAREVTSLSGRGVGLDAVRRQVESLRGTLSVESRERLGCTFTLRVPLTLAIIPGFMVGAGAQVYVLPLDAVEECLELPAEAGRTDAAQGVVRLRDEPLPYLRLRTHFGLAAEHSGREALVVVRTESGRAGLVTDSLLGESHVVIKPMGSLLRRLPGLAGASALADGRVALVLDVPALFAAASAPGAAASLRSFKPRGT